jgi:hypothetical protein
MPKMRPRRHRGALQANKDALSRVSPPPQRGHTVTNLRSHPHHSGAINLSTERYSAPVRPVEFAAFTLGAYNLSTERYSAPFTPPTPPALHLCAYNLSTERYSAPGHACGGINRIPVPTTYRLKGIQHVVSKYSPPLTYTLCLQPIDLPWLAPQRLLLRAAFEVLLSAQAQDHTTHTDDAPERKMVVTQPLGDLAGDQTQTTSTFALLDPLHGTPNSPNQSALITNTRLRDSLRIHRCKWPIAFASCLQPID